MPRSVPTGIGRELNERSTKDVKNPEYIVNTREGRDS